MEAHLSRNCEQLTSVGCASGRLDALVERGEQVEAFLYDEANYAIAVEDKVRA